GGGNENKFGHLGKTKDLAPGKMALNRVFSLSAVIKQRSLTTYQLSKPWPCPNFFYPGPRISASAVKSWGACFLPGRRHHGTSAKSCARSSTRWHSAEADTEAESPSNSITRCWPNSSFPRLLSATPFVARNKASPSCKARTAASNVVCVKRPRGIALGSRTRTPLASRNKASRLPALQ